MGTYIYCIIIPKDVIDGNDESLVIKTWNFLNIEEKIDLLLILNLIPNCWLARGTNLHYLCSEVKPNIKYLKTNIFPYAYLITCFYPCTWGHAVAQLVEALRYKPEGRGFDSRWYNWNFSLT
jgi:hypothetical protein